MPNARENVVSKFEKGKPADPTQNMSAEQAAKWREMNEEHGDKFKSARYVKGDPRWIHARYPGKADDGTPFKRGDLVLYWPRTKTFMVGKKAEDAWRKFEMEVDDEEVYSRSWERYAKESGMTDTSSEEVVSRFEEGKPADPTKNMSPEDAKKWREEHQKNKDKFKKDAAAPQFKSVETKDCKLIDRMVSQRTKVDWVTDSRDEEYQRRSEEEGFHEHILPQYQRELEEINDIINEAAKRLVRRLVGFERASLPEFEDLGFNVKLGKPTPVYGSGRSDWADYDFRQEVSITDKVYGGTDTLKLTWSFRDFVRMSDGGRWTHFDSNKSGGRATFPEMALTVSNRLHDWDRFVARREESMREKGLKAAAETADEGMIGRFEEGKPADPTKNMSPEDAKKWREENEKNKDKFKSAGSVVGRFLEKVGGFSYATDRMSVLFVEGRKPVPFNIDTIRVINRTTIPVVADDGNVHDVNLKVLNNVYSGPLTYQQEKMGWKRETRVDVQFPLDEGGDVDTSERATLAALAKVGKKFGFKVEPTRRGYKPKTRK